MLEFSATILLIMAAASRVDYIGDNKSLIAEFYGLNCSKTSLIVNSVLYNNQSSTNICF